MRWRLLAGAGVGLFIDTSCACACACACRRRERGRSIREGSRGSRLRASSVCFFLSLSCLSLKHRTCGFPQRCMHTVSTSTWSTWTECITAGFSHPLFASRFRLEPHPHGYPRRPEASTDHRHRRPSTISTTSIAPAAVTTALTATRPRLHHPHHHHHLSHHHGHRLHHHPAARPGAPADCHYIYGDRGSARAERRCSPIATPRAVYYSLLLLLPAAPPSTAAAAE